MILGKLRAILRHKNYKLYTRPYELNIVGMRGDSIIPNRFDDEMHVFYKTDKDQWNYHVFKCTTDPGTYWLQNPMQPQGTGILAQGQYIDTYQLGLHRGEYEALVQRKPVTVIRDYNRNALLDFNNGTRTTGLYGINIHRASAHGETKTVGKYSAGCQVFENADAFAQFIRLCEHHRDLYGNHFTYTLIDFRAMRRETQRRKAMGFGIAGGIIVCAALAYFGRESLKQIAEEISETFTHLKNKNENDNQRNPAPAFER